MNRIKNWVRYLLPALVLAMTCAVPAFGRRRRCGWSRRADLDRCRQSNQDGSGQRGVSCIEHDLSNRVFVKLAMCYFDYRKHGQFEWTGPAILFVCLIFVLLAPNYIWGIVGI